MYGSQTPVQEGERGNNYLDLTQSTGHKIHTFHTYMYTYLIFIYDPNMYICLSLILFLCVYISISISIRLNPVAIVNKMKKLLIIQVKYNIFLTLLFLQLEAARLTTALKPHCMMGAGRRVRAEPGTPATPTHPPGNTHTHTHTLTLTLTHTHRHYTCKHSGAHIS